MKETVSEIADCADQSNPQSFADLVRAKQLLVAAMREAEDADIDDRMGALLRQSALARSLMNILSAI